MTHPQVNKIMAISGSFFLSNGMILSLAPDRFANLRKMSWMPDPYNRVLNRVAEHTGRGRVAGLLITLIGASLLLLAVWKTEPADTS